jgi:hypothetical protein
MAQILKLTHVKTYTWTSKIKLCYILSCSCYLSVIMAHTVRKAQHWLKLLPAVMALVQGHMYDSGVLCMYVIGVCFWGSTEVLTHYSKLGINLYPAKVIYI